MNRGEFVKALKLVVHDRSVSDVVQTIENPPGRQPPRRATELARWDSELSDADKRFVREIVLRSVHAATHSLLCVLDGVLAIEDPPEKGTLDLRYRKGRQESPLNGPEGEELHDLYQAEVWQEVYGDGPTTPCT